MTSKTGTRIRILGRLAFALVLAAGIAACSSVGSFAPAPGLKKPVTASPPLITPRPAVPQPLADEKGNRTSLTALPPR